MGLALQLFLFTLVSPWAQVDCNTSDSGENDETFDLSTRKLRRLAECESSIFGALDQLHKEEHDDLPEPVFRYLNDYDSSSGIAHGSVPRIVNHPLLAFRMLYRFVYDLPEVWSEAYDLGEWPVLPTGCPWPKEEDLNDAMEGLLRLTFTLDLNLMDFSKGSLHGTETGFGLAVRHVMEIGQYALDVGNYHALAVEWLELAKVMALEFEFIDLELNITALDELIRQAVAYHDEAFATTEGYVNTFFLRKIVPRQKYPYEFDGWMGRRKQRTLDVDLYAGETHPDYREINYWALCSGTLRWSSVETSHLFCWYDAPVPFYRFQVELLASAPRVLQIYNVASAATCDKMVDATEQSMIPSVVFVTGGVAEIVGMERTSFTSWLPKDLPLSLKLDNMVNYITGLRTLDNASENWQMASYTPFGSHYLFHLDESQERLERIPEDARIATFMIYLSDVEGGGATAFVDAQVTVRPVKGSAVFWYNIDPFGNVDEFTHHAACPVYLGTKWVANKWISYLPQLDLRQCPIHFHPNSK